MLTDHNEVTTRNEMAVPDTTTADTGTTAAVGTPEENSNSDSPSGDDDCTFVKNMLHSLPPMKHEELENIVHQTSQLLVSSMPNTGVNDPVSLWNENVIDPFWMEYQSRTCRHLATEAPPSSSSQRHKPQLPIINDTEEYLLHLRKQIEDYQTSRYGDKPHCTAKYQATASRPNTTTDNADHDDTPDIIRIRTHVEYIDTANCCTASWHVDWTVQRVQNTTATLSGTVQVHTHYYENNTNSQLQCDRVLVQNHSIALPEEKVNSLVAQFEKNTLSYAEKLVTQIVQCIIRTEEEFFTSITDYILSNHHDDAIHTANTTPSDQLRALRRILPITKHKFAWNHSSHSTRQQQQTNIQLMLLQQQQQQQNRSKKK